MDKNERKKRAFGYSFATMLILFGVLGVIICDNIFYNDFPGVLFLFICLIPAVGIYVYLGCTNEENEYKAKYYSNYNKKHNSISSIVWLLAVSLFFIIGFVFDGWEYAWIVYLIAAAINHFITLFYDDSKKEIEKF